MLTKPARCRGCTLETRGEGFAPADGDPSSWLLLVGEALGKVEALTGRPFMGDAGGMLQRLLNMLGWSRDALRIHNVISCRPPNDWFDERAPWFRTALNFCPYLADTLGEGHDVVVAMGGTALRRLLNLQHYKKVRVQDFHGAILRDPTDRYWVVPTFHPSFLQRGAHNLIGTVLWDLTQAAWAREHGRPPDPASLIVDPSPEWFAAWVDVVVAARTAEPDAFPLSSDVETPDKAGGQDEGEITAEDQSYQLLRHNLAVNPDEGITVPHVGPYLDELRRLYASPGPIWMWNREYDFVRQLRHGLMTEADSVKVVDLMWLAKVLQSDVPLGLGFWAPFYSRFGPWKHIAATEPGRYGAIDGLQTHRVGFGLVTDLHRQGQYDAAMRHTHRLLTSVLRPAQLVGVQIDRPRLLDFKADLADKARAQLAKIQACVPEALAPLTPKQGYRHRPKADVLHTRATAFTRKGTLRKGKAPSEIKQELYARAKVVEKILLAEVLCCRSCGATEVQRRHRCPRPAVGGSPAGAPDLTVEVASVRRWYWQEPFNPDSPPQVLAYIKHRGHTPGRAKKSQSEESTDRQTLERLTRTADPFYAALLDYRAIVKVKGTYVEGTERRLDAEDRLHPRPTFRPSTMRLSYVDPNITNVVADKSGADGLAAGFRRCVVASPGCRLLEVDFSAIEAVETGWWARDPFLIRLARLGIHSYLIAVRLGDAPSLDAPDADIAAHLKAVKQKAGPLLYDQVKHTVYGVFYGQTPFGLQHTWPHLYPTPKVAEEMVEFMYHQIPSVPAFQKAVLLQADKEHCLGGPQVHPFGYRHWFWNVYSYRRLTTTQYYRLCSACAARGLDVPAVEMNGQMFRRAYGPDANRAIAFYPQSTAEGVLEMALLRLLADRDSPSYIGDAYFGRTPLRAPIHDSGLFEIPVRAFDRVYERICLEMRRPIVEQPLPAWWGMGPHLSIGIAAKAGDSWADTSDLLLPAVDGLSSPAEDSDTEDWEALQRAV